MSRAHDRELEAFMQRFYKLRDADKLRAYKSIRDHLGDRVGQAGRRDEIVRMRAAALEALGVVRDHLGLSADRAPAMAVSDGVARASIPARGGGPLSGHCAAARPACKTLWSVDSGLPIAL